jgi:ribosomal protein S27E
LVVVVVVVVVVVETIAMDLKIKNANVRTSAAVRSRCLALTCPRCRQATVRYWPDYDETGEILSCPGCHSVYELTDGGAGIIAPLDAEDGAPRPERS